MVFKTPDCTLTVERFLDVFVDDAQKRNKGVIPYQAMVPPRTLRQPTTQLPILEKLLYCSSCFWKWFEGLPIPLTKDEITAQIQPFSLTSGSSKSAILIALRDVTEAHKTLGVRLSPDGNNKSSSAYYLETHSNKMSVLISASNLNRVESMLAYIQDKLVSHQRLLPWNDLSNTHYSTKYNRNQTKCVSPRQASTVTFPEQLSLAPLHTADSIFVTSK